MCPCKLIKSALLFTNPVLKEHVRENEKEKRKREKRKEISYLIP